MLKEKSGEIKLSTAFNKHGAIVLELFRVEEVRGPVYQKLGD